LQVLDPIAAELDLTLFFTLGGHEPIALVLAVFVVVVAGPLEVGIDDRVDDKRRLVRRLAGGLDLDEVGVLDDRHVQRRPDLCLGVLATANPLQGEQLVMTDDRVLDHRRRGDDVDLGLFVDVEVAVGAATEEPLPERLDPDA
jgi:hypothetical protein